MLIIFDLDDTLIDTSGCAGPIKLRIALRAMMEARLNVISEEEAFASLQEIDRHSPNGRETLRQFLEKLNANAHLLEIGTKEYYGKTEVDFPVTALEEAVDTLTQLKKKHQLILISTGVEEEQFRKMKSAGITTTIFQKIVICQEYNKKKYYQQLQQEFNCPSSEILICADKFETDLLPAQELGMKTVQILWGRALTTPKTGNPDYQIRKIKELLSIVDKVSS